MLYLKGREVSYIRAKGGYPRSQNKCMVELEIQHCGTDCQVLLWTQPTPTRNRQEAFITLS